MLYSLFPDEKHCLRNERKCKRFQIVQGSEVALKNLERMLCIPLHLKVWPCGLEVR